MSERKHTPGPWDVQPSQLSGHFNVMSSDGFYVAEAFEMFGIDDRDETEANARLIAAAPTMLEVLQHADQLLGYFHWDSGEGRTDKFELVQRIRDAIRTATGEQK